MMSEENAAEQDKNEAAVEAARAEIEKVMMELPLCGVELHQQYLAGYIDCMGEKGHINEQTREILYAEYAL